MFETVIKYNLLKNEDINFLNDNLCLEKFTINPSAKEDGYTVLHSCHMDDVKNSVSNQIIDDLNSKLISMVEKIYTSKVLVTIGNSIVKYTQGKFIGVHKDWQENDDWVIKNNRSTVHISSVFYINDNYLRWRDIFL